MIIDHNWQHAIETVLRHEGKFVDNPNDPGGATKYGISLRWLISLGQINGHLVGDIDGDGDVDIDDIRSLDIDQTMLLYRQRWWEKYGYDRIIDQWAATKVLDMSVNMGSRQAHLLVQRALSAAEQPVAVDGVFGPASLAAVNSADRQLFKGALRATQAGFYWHLIQVKPSLREFEAGWMNRAYA